MWTPWKKKTDEEGIEKKEEKGPSVLQQVCGGDDELYGFTSGYLCVNPLATVSKKTLDELLKEAAENGDYRPPLDKAIFEATQKPKQKQHYEGVIKDIAGKTITATEQQIAKAEQQGLTDRANFLRKRIADQKTLQERVSDVIDTATSYYGERVIELKEEAAKKERLAQLEEIENAKWGEELAEEAEREELKGMGHEERKKAEAAAEAKRKALKEAARKAEVEEAQLEAEAVAAREERLEHLNKS